MVNDYYRAATRQSSGNADGTHGPACVSDSVEMEHLLGPYRTTRGRRLDQRIRQQQLLRDSVAKGFEHALRLVLIGEPVIQFITLLDEPVRQFVCESEVFTLA